MSELNAIKSAALELAGGKELVGLPILTRLLQHKWEAAIQSGDEEFSLGILTANDGRKCRILAVVARSVEDGTFSMCFGVQSQSCDPISKVVDGWNQWKPVGGAARLAKAIAASQYGLESNPEQSCEELFGISVSVNC